MMTFLKSFVSSRNVTTTGNFSIGPQFMGRATATLLSPVPSSLCRPGSPFRVGLFFVCDIPWCRRVGGLDVQENSDC